MTGQGKSLIFILPILNKISKDPFGVHSLVLVPSRELAINLKDQFIYYGFDINLRVVVLTGGQDFITQIK